MPFKSGGQEGEIRAKPTPDWEGLSHANSDWDCGMPGSLWPSGSLAPALGALRYFAGDTDGKPYSQSPDLVLQRNIC